MGLYIKIPKEILEEYIFLVVFLSLFSSVCFIM